MKTRVLVLACAAILALAVSASATVWSIADAFSATDNPSGAWKYWSWFSGGLMTANGAYQGDTNIAGWWKDAGSTAPYVLQTQTGAEYVAAGVHFMPDEVTMKSAGGDWAIVTWTCPVTADYYWFGQYTGREEGGSTRVQAYSSIYLNWDGGYVGYGEVSSFDIPVEASATRMLNLTVGSTFDFYIEGGAVGLKGFFTDDPNMIPEPSALMALFTGVIGTSSLAIRRKRS